MFFSKNLAAIGALSLIFFVAAAPLPAGAGVLETPVGGWGIKAPGQPSPKPPRGGLASTAGGNLND